MIKWCEKNKRIDHLVFSYRLCDLLSPQDFQPNSWSLGTSALTVLVAALRCAMHTQSCKSTEQLMDLYIAHLPAFPKQNTIETPLAVELQSSPQPGPLPGWNPYAKPCELLMEPQHVPSPLYQEYFWRWWMGMWKLQKPLKLFFSLHEKRKIVINKTALIS